MNAYEQLTYQDVQSTIPTPTYHFMDHITGKWQQSWNQYTADVNNAWMTYLQNRRQEEREDSSYQRLKTDLEKAGLNPYYILNQSSASPVSMNAYKSFKGNKLEGSSSFEDILKELVSGAFSLFKIMAILK